MSLCTGDVVAAKPLRGFVAEFLRLEASSALICTWPIKRFRTRRFLIC
jgi:hypothetical protein